MKFAKTALTVAAVAGITLTTIPAASANSFNGSSADGKWSYTDSTDTFCLQATPAGRGHEGIVATLRPATAGRGPSYTIGLAPGQHRCVSLAKAYEDSKYIARISGNKTDKTLAFYS